MADAGFPRGGAILIGGSNLLFGIIFSENCIKMKNIGFRGTRSTTVCCMSKHFEAHVQRAHLHLLTFDTIFQEIISNFIVFYFLPFLPGYDYSPEKQKKRK